MNADILEVLATDYLLAQQLMKMLDQHLSELDILCGKLGNEWVVTAENYIQRLASPVEAYRDALELAQNIRVSK